MILNVSMTTCRVPGNKTHTNDNHEYTCMYSYVYIHALGNMLIAVL